MAVELNGFCVRPPLRPNVCRPIAFEWVLWFAHLREQGLAPTGE